MPFLRRLRHLPFVLEIIGTWTVVRFLVSALPFDRLLRREQVRPISPSTGGSDGRARALLVERAEAFFCAMPIQPSCLVRSLIILHLLRRRNLSADLTIGVRLEAGRLEAHAWLAEGHGIVSDLGDTRQEFNGILLSGVPR